MPLSWLFMTVNVLSRVRSSIRSRRGRNRLFGARGRCDRATIGIENGNFFDMFVNGDIAVVSGCEEKHSV